jgi:hypothetical protein
MSIYLNQRSGLRNFVAACMIILQAVLPCLVAAQSGQGGGTGNGAVGFVSSMSGPVFIRRGTGELVRAKPGDVFGPETSFVTGNEGGVLLLFADGQNIALGKDSELRVGDYRFDLRDPKTSRATFALQGGIMRFVTGAIHTDNNAGLIVSAGDASIGILSKDVTAFVVEVDPRSLSIGAAAVTIGEISVQTPVGPVQRVLSDQFARWQSSGVSPAAPLAAAPAIFQAAVAALLANVQVSNLPVDVQAAAILAALAGLPATAAGQPQPQADPVVAVVLPTVTPGGGRGCVGSPC